MSLPPPPGRRNLPNSGRPKHVGLSRPMPTRAEQSQPLRSSAPGRALPGRALPLGPPMQIEVEPVEEEFVEDQYEDDADYDTSDEDFADDDTPVYFDASSVAVEDDDDELDDIPLPSKAGTVFRGATKAPVERQVTLPLQDPATAPPPFSSKIQASIDLLLSALSEESSEILMNGPDDILYTIDGARYQMPDMDFEDTETYHRVINEVLLPMTDTKDRIGERSYLIEGQLEYHDGGEEPVLARVHVVAPPVVKNAVVTIAKKARKNFSLEDLAERGSMTYGMSEFLMAAAKARINIVFSGLSGAGKTTLLEALTYHFDPNDRVIVVEDTKELRLPLSDTVYMTATSSKPGETKEDVVTMEWLVKATNRMRPTRIIVGECRGAELSEFLIAANSGADGSLTTLHAADPRMTLEKMISLAMKAEGSKNENTVRRDIASTVQLVVQATIINGRHIISHIEEISRTVNNTTGVIGTQTIFEYDRINESFRSDNLPSTELQSYMSQRGVGIEMGWFREDHAHYQ